MKYVYLLSSEIDPQPRYVGLTENLKSRLTAHNSGRSFHTAKFKPWKVVAYFAFADQNCAVDFEKYLKTGSGRSFANKHLWPRPGSESNTTRNA